MLHERVAEALQNVIGKLLQLRFGKIQGGKKLVEHHLVNELADFGILAAFLHGVKAAKVANRAQNRVRAVQKSNLPFVVRSL